MFNQLLNNMFCEGTAGDSPKTPLGLLFGSNFRIYIKLFGTSTDTRGEGSGAETVYRRP